MTTALIAEDEPLMLQRLKQALHTCWPALQIVAEAKNGDEAIAAIDKLKPDIVFLDIRMPGKTGLEVAAHIGEAAHVVFVTAYDEYAVTAFEQGAVDYLLKPVERARLEVTVARLKSRLQARRGDAPSAEPAALASSDRGDALMATLQQLQRQMHSQQASGMAPVPKLRWLQCSTGNSVKLIAVDDVLFFRSDEKYTRLQLDGSEALIRTPIRELAMQLDEQRFWQIHRSTIVNLSAIASVQRDESGRQRVQLKNHREVLEVSRSYGNLFRHQ